MQENIIYINIANEFSKTPGARSITLGKNSGELFRKVHLEKYFVDPKYSGFKLIVDIDGAEGYPPSFLEEAFGGLVRKFGKETVKARLEIRAEIFTFFKKKAEMYIDEADHIVQ